MNSLFLVGQDSQDNVSGSLHILLVFFHYSRKKERFL